MRIMSSTNTTAASGAYCRSIAWKLMLRAALRYFSESVRSDCDKCDIPVKRRLMSTDAAWSKIVRTVQGVPSPKQLLHVFGHDTRDVLQLVVELIEVVVGDHVPCVLVQPCCLAHEGVCTPVILAKSTRYITEAVPPNPTNAYGLRTLSTLVPYDVSNSLDSSSRYENASFRGYDLSAMTKYTTLPATR